MQYHLKVTTKDGKSLTLPEFEAPNDETAIEMIQVDSLN